MENENNLHDKFVKKLNPYPYGSEKYQESYSEIYAMIDISQNMVEIKKNDEIIVKDTIVISLINEAMLDTDLEYLKRDEYDDYYYVPYVYEFVLDDNKENIKKFFSSFKKYIIGKRRWFKIKLSTKMSDGIRGTVYFSASIFNPKAIYLEFLDEVKFDDIDKDLKNMSNKRINSLGEKLRRLESLYYKGEIYSNNEVVKEVLNDKLKSVFNTKYSRITVYNVGQANFIYVCNKNNSNRILFDAGIERKHDHNLKNLINNLKPKAIILSHWDLDHILAVKYIDDDHWPEIWVASDIMERKGQIILSAHRLAAYLSKKKCIYMVGEKYNGNVIYNGNDTSLYKGNAEADGIGKGENDYNNNHGLILTIKNGNCNAVLPGDCEYMAWPESISLIKNEYDILLVPHHGALCNLKDSECSNDYMLGIISYGSGNVHKHPSGEMMLKLSNKYNCDIIGTEGKKYIRIELLNNRYRAILKYEDFEEEINVFKVEQYHRVEKISRNFVSNIVSERLR